MKALYKNRLCHIVDVRSDVTLAEEGRQFVVSLGDEALVIDPQTRRLQMPTIFVSGTGLTPTASIAFAVCSAAICPARALVELGVVG